MGGGGGAHGPPQTSRVELTRSRGSSVWSRQEAKLGDNPLSYLIMPPLSTLRVPLQPIAVLADNL